MKVFGLDFTSAPTSNRSQARRQKLLMLATAHFDGTELSIKDFTTLNGPAAGDYTEFDHWLTTPGPWIAGIDFPFAQPVELVRALGWPTADWSSTVEHVRWLGKAGFEAALRDFCAAQPPGQKHRRRPVDVWAKSISPMTLHRTPVGKMFFQGAPRLLDSPASIPILRPIAGETRTVVEAYPALIARRWIGGQSYKNDDPKLDDSGRKLVRQTIVRSIQGEDAAPGPPIAAVYGLTVVMSEAIANQCVADPTGDLLDSVLCAIQAAWACGQGPPHYGLLPVVDPLEGWIADPGS